MKAATKPVALKAAAINAAPLLLVCVLGCPSASVRHPSLAAVPTTAFPTTWEGAHLASAPEARGVAVAVLELHNRLEGEDRKALQAPYLANAVRAAVKRALPASRVMTKENLQVLLAASGKTLDDCEGECEVETGRLLGADLIVTGDLLRVGSHLKLDLRMHDTRTGQLVSGALASGVDVDSLDADLPRALGELIAPLR